MHNRLYAALLAILSVSCVCSQRASNAGSSRLHSQPQRSAAQIQVAVAAVEPLSAPLQAAYAGGARVAATPAERALSPAVPLQLDACGNFAANPICHQLPSNPRISSKNKAWQKLEFSGRNYFGPLNTGRLSGGTHFSDRDDGAYPLDDLRPGDPSVSNVVTCDGSSWGINTCNGAGIEGKTIRLPVRADPAGSSDHHYSWNDYAAHGEYDFWLAAPPVAHGGTLHIGAGGFCKWGGDGTGCSGSTATNIATSLGAIDPALLRAGERDAHGTLGYAIAASTVCADVTYVYPATASDGANTNDSPPCVGSTGPAARPPEGTRWFLNKSDDDINATRNLPYVKVLLRTMDREHYGGMITDTNWAGAPGLSPAAKRGDWSFTVQELGQSSSDDRAVPITVDGITLENDVEFCSNGTC